ncbi:MAG: hypothetical protein ABI834_03740 [Ginsengibacter sp.]
MVEVFKTNVGEVSEADKLVILLLQYFPKSKINFDLHDCDNILRLDGKDFVTEKVLLLLKENGFICKVLE